MQVKKFAFSDRGVEAAVSVCRPSPGVAAEYNLTVRPLVYASAREQVKMVRDAYLRVLKELGVSPDTALFRRFFCSDLVNQRPDLDAVDIASPADAGCAISFIEQPPLPDCKVAMWAYHVADPDTGESTTWTVVLPENLFARPEFVSTQVGDWTVAALRRPGR